MAERIKKLEGVYDMWIDERVKNYLNEIHEKVNELIEVQNGGEDGKRQER